MAYLRSRWVFQVIVLHFAFISTALSTQQVEKDDDDPTRVLQGTWYNELGSSVYLEQDENGTISGHYSTAVESTPGAAGGPGRLLYGHSSIDHGQNPTFGFTVVWPKSSTSFTGHYYNVNGEETLLTTWILTSEVSNIGDYWMANRVGFNKFKRNRLVKEN